MNIAEIAYADGAVRYRYSRYMSEYKTRWIRHDLFCEYYQDGTLASEGQYVDGKENGLWRDFHSNGAVAAEGRYQAGEEVGVWRFWNADGTPSDTRPI